MTDLASPASFWKRHFTGPATESQRARDIAFGIVLPILCVVFDPIVFKGDLGRGRGALLMKYQVVAYCFIAFEIVALSLWHLKVLRTGFLSATAAGVLFAGALASFLLGVALFPLSLMGSLLAGIGLLGFTPFFTAYVFFRNAVRARQLAREALSGFHLHLPMCVAVIVVMGLPFAVHQATDRLVESALTDIASADPAASERAIQRLRFLKPLANLDDLVWRYERETDPPTKRRIADAYFRLTHSQIENRLGVLMD